MWKWKIWRKAGSNMDNQDNTDNIEQADCLDNAGGAREINDLDHADNAGEPNHLDHADSIGQTDNLDHATRALTTAILESGEYLSYRAELEKVLQFPELKAQIDDFRLRNFQLQSSADIDLSTMERFDREYEDFLNNPMVSDFLEAELAFCKRMQQIENSIVTELDFQ